MSFYSFLSVAEHLELAGLLWQPEIGDEVSQRANKEVVSILFDPLGMTPRELRSTFLWLPTVEQLVSQVEARRAILFHAGLELKESSMCYKSILQCDGRQIEGCGDSLRVSLGIALRDLLVGGGDANMH